MKRGILVLAFGVAACANFGPYQPWRTSAIPDAKPASPVRAPSDAALLVVAVVHPQGEGNGAFTVFEADGTPVAQFDAKDAPRHDLDPAR